MPIQALKIAENVKLEQALSLKRTESVSKALQLSSQSFNQTRSALKSRLSLRDCQQQPLSHSVSEAQAAVQTREDEKKKQQARKDKAKSSTPTPAQEACPGAEQGAESTKSAYWLFTEVNQVKPLLLLGFGAAPYPCIGLQAYFRDVTQEDLQVLLPAFHDPLTDPVYKVPPIGPHFSADDLILSPRATRGFKAVTSKRTVVSYTAHTVHLQVQLLWLHALPQLLPPYTMNTLQAPSLLSAHAHAGSQALEDADTVGGSDLMLPSVCEYV